MEVASLKLAIDHSDIGKSASEMGKLQASSAGLENTTKFLNRAFAEFATGLVSTTAIFGAVSAIAMDTATHLDRVRERSQQLAHEMTAASVAAGGLEKSLRAELAVLGDAVPGSRTYLSALNDLEVTKARLYALGPEYRKGINDEVMSYQDLLGVLRKINQEKLRSIEIQIVQQERRVDKASRPGWLTDVGLTLAGTGPASGLGSYLQARGIESTLNLMNEENKRLDKLYKDRAELMALLRDPKPEMAAAAGAVATVAARARGPQDNPLSNFYYLTIPERSIQSLEVATVNTMNLELASAKLRQEYGRMRIVIPSTADIITEAVSGSSRMATDELVRWMNNLDGVGRSWRTLGDTVRAVLRDMVIQMQRAIIQQQLMDPLIRAATNPSTWSWLTGSTGTTATTGGSAGGGLNWGEVFAAAPSGNSQTSIVVNMNGGKGADASVQQGDAVDLARMIEGVCNEWAVKNSRSGGVLARG